MLELVSTYSTVQAFLSETRFLFYLATRKLAMSYIPQQFIRLKWLSVGTCPVFVAVTEPEIVVQTHRRTVLISGHVLYNSYFRFRSVLGFIPSPFAGNRVTNLV